MAPSTQSLSVWDGRITTRVHTAGQGDPVVFLHGAGQTGVDWLQTPDGRPGWAYNFLDMGYVVYLEDFPARGRSQYVPGVDGTNACSAPGC